MGREFEPLPSHQFNQKRRFYMIPYEDVTEEIIAKEAYKIYPYGSRVYHTASEI